MANIKKIKVNNVDNDIEALHFVTGSLDTPAQWKAYIDEGLKIPKIILSGSSGTLTTDQLAIILNNYLVAEVTSDGQLINLWYKFHQTDTDISLYNLPDPGIVKYDWVDGFPEFSDGADWFHVTISDRHYSIGYEGSTCFIENMVTIGYTDFVQKVENGELHPGTQYHIVDYTTRINGVYDLSILGQSGAYLPYATSAEHRFDLIVTATGPNTYDENVKAIQNADDETGYFEHSNLAAWELKWTHKNDRSQYSWADDVNGKGVIYYMKDEFDNEAFYDFKNVQNLQFALRRVDDTIATGESFEYDEDTSSAAYQPNRYGTLYDVFSVLQGGSINNNLEFDVEDINGTSAIMLLTAIQDVSKETLDSTMNWTYMLAVLSQMMGTTVTLAMLAQLLGTTEQVLSAMTERQVIQNFFNAGFYYTFNLNLSNTFYDYTSYYNYDDQEDVETYGGAYCHSNHIGPTTDALTSYVDEIATIPNGLNVITFENFNEGSYNWGNLLGTGNALIVFGDSCVSNVFENRCWNNKFGCNVVWNTFKNSFEHSWLGTGCEGNSFGSLCYSIYLGRQCSLNSFGNHCYNNSLGSSCSMNSFGETCNYNSFGNYCDYNSFGNACYSNSLGNSCQNNSFGNHCNENSFGNACFSNSFGNSCQQNSFGDNCFSNSFGNSCNNNSFDAGNCCNNSFSEYCCDNSFGYSCDENSFDNYCQDNSLVNFSMSNIFENSTSHINLTGNTTGSYNNYLKNVKICQGVHGTDNSHLLTITATRNLDYQVEYKATGSTEIILGGNN